jgi:hypothetical protein
MNNFLSAGSSSSGTSSNGYSIAQSVMVHTGENVNFSTGVNITRPAIDIANPHDPNRLLFTISLWVKRGKLGVAATTSSKQYLLVAASGGMKDFLEFTKDNRLRFRCGTSITKCDVSTIGTFNDVSAWYHIVLAIDTSAPTGIDRCKIFVNGVQTGLLITQEMEQHWDMWGFNNSLLYHVGYALGDYSSYPNFSGLVTEVALIDDYCGDASDFGEVSSQTGQWIPKLYTGPTTNSSFYFRLSPATMNLANHHFSTVNSIWTLEGANNDMTEDTPTNNYPTWNSLGVSGSYYGQSGLWVDSQRGVWGRHDVATQAIPSTGKWYWEYDVSYGYYPDEFTRDIVVGLMRDDAPHTTSAECIGRFVGSYGFNVFHRHSVGMEYYSNGTADLTFTLGNTFAYGATSPYIVGFAFDADTGRMELFMNGVSRGSRYISLSDSGRLLPAITMFFGEVLINFGQLPFRYTPPTGYKELCTANLPEPDIKNPEIYFAPILYDGNGIADRAINTPVTTPNLVWIKNRTDLGTEGGPTPSHRYNNHLWFDTVRGSAGWALASNLDSAQWQDTGILSNIGTNSFTLGAQYANQNTTHVAYTWSKGVTQGFDIVTGALTSGGPATIPHALGTKPDVIIYKPTDITHDWVVQASALGNMTTNYLWFSSTPASQFGVRNDASALEPTSSNIHISEALSPCNVVAYVFAEVEGFSRFGTYVGNGSTIGSFVYTGFKPAFVLCKAIWNVAHDPNFQIGLGWGLCDGARNPMNVDISGGYSSIGLTREHNPGVADPETAWDGVLFRTQNIDLLSNGFKHRGTLHNQAGFTYFYMAFAESPFKYSTAR